MKNFFQRKHESHSGTRKPTSRNLDEVRSVPHTKTQEGYRYKLSAAYAEYGNPKSDLHGSGEKRGSSKPPQWPDRHYESYTTSTSYNYPTTPSIGWTPYSLGHSRAPTLNPPLQSRSSRQHAEVHEIRPQSHKNAVSVLPSPQSSAEKVYKHMGSTKSPPTKSSRSEYVLSEAAVPPPTFWIPPVHPNSKTEGPSQHYKNDARVNRSRDWDMGKENERNAEREAGIEKDKERKTAKEQGREVETDRKLDRDRDRYRMKNPDGKIVKAEARENGRVRERDSLRGREKERERERPMDQNEEQGRRKRERGGQDKRGERYGDEERDWQQVKDRLQEGERKAKPRERRRDEESRREYVKDTPREIDREDKRREQHVDREKERKQVWNKYGEGDRQEKERERHKYKGNVRNVERYREKDMEKAGGREGRDGEREQPATVLPKDHHRKRTAGPMSEDPGEGDKATIKGKHGYDRQYEPGRERRIIREASTGEVMKAGSGDGNTSDSSPWKHTKTLSRDRRYRPEPTDSDTAIRGPSHEPPLMSGFPPQSSFALISSDNQAAIGTGTSHMPVYLPAKDLQHKQPQARLHTRSELATSGFPGNDADSAKRRELPHHVKDFIPGTKGEQTSRAPLVDTSHDSRHSDTNPIEPKTSSSRWSFLKLREAPKKLLVPRLDSDSSETINLSTEKRNVHPPVATTKVIEQHPGVVHFDSQAPLNNVVQLSRLNPVASGQLEAEPSISTSHNKYLREHSRNSPTTATSLHQVPAATPRVISPGSHHNLPLPTADVDAPIGTTAPPTPVYSSPNIPSTVVPNKPQPVSAAQLPHAPVLSTQRSNQSHSPKMPLYGALDTSYRSETAATRPNEYHPYGESSAHLPETTVPKLDYLRSLDTSPIDVSGYRDISLKPQTAAVESLPPHTEKTQTHSGDLAAHSAPWSSDATAELQTRAQSPHDPFPPPIPYPSNNTRKDISQNTMRNHQIDTPTQSLPTLNVDKLLQRNQAHIYNSVRDAQNPSRVWQMSEHKHQKEIPNVLTGPPVSASASVSNLIAEFETRSRPQSLLPQIDPISLVRHPMAMGSGPLTVKGIYHGLSPVLPQGNPNPLPLEAQVFDDINTHLGASFQRPTNVSSKVERGGTDPSEPVSLQPSQGSLQDKNRLTDLKQPLTSESTILPHILEPSSRKHSVHMTDHQTTIPPPTQVHRPSFNQETRSENKVRQSDKNAEHTFPFPDDTERTPPASHTRKIHITSTAEPATISFPRSTPHQTTDDRHRDNDRPLTYTIGQPNILPLPQASDLKGRETIPGVPFQDLAQDLRQRKQEPRPSAQAYRPTIHHAKLAEVLTSPLPVRIPEAAQPETAPRVIPFVSKPPSPIIQPPHPMHTPPSTPKLRQSLSYITHLAEGRSGTQPVTGGPRNQPSHNKQLQYSDPLRSSSTPPDRHSPRKNVTIEPHVHGTTGSQQSMIQSTMNSHNNESTKTPQKHRSTSTTPSSLNYPQSTASRSQSKGYDHTPHPPKKTKGMDSFRSNGAAIPTINQPTGAPPRSTKPTPQTTSSHGPPFEEEPTNNLPVAPSYNSDPYIATATRHNGHTSALRPHVYSRVSNKLSHVPSEESILKTPSSLALSTLKPTASHTSIPASISSQPDSRKKGLFGMFRSKSVQPPSQTHEVQVPPAKQDANKTSKASAVASVGDIKAVTSLSSRAKIPPPISVPIPIIPTSSHKNHNSKVFTPFRYLASKRNRTMSAASVEAQDGTAPNTVGSPTASMHSTQPPIQPPPLRDPFVATQEWRKQEAAEARARSGGKLRRQRPGVVFDVAEDPLEDQKRSRPSRSRAHLGSSSGLG